jgi:hypothetical protein
MMTVQLSFAQRNAGVTCRSPGGAEAPTAGCCIIMWAAGGASPPRRHARRAPLPRRAPARLLTRPSPLTAHPATRPRAPFSSPRAAHAAAPPPPTLCAYCSCARCDARRTTARRDGGPARPGGGATGGWRPTAGAEGLYDCRVPRGATIVPASWQRMRRPHGAAPPLIYIYTST